MYQKRQTAYNPRDHDSFQLGTRCEPVLVTAAPHISRRQLNRRIRENPLPALFEFHPQMDFGQMLECLRDFCPVEFTCLWQKIFASEKNKFLQSLNYIAVQNGGYVLSPKTMDDLKNRIQQILKPWQTPAQQKRDRKKKIHRLLEALNPETLVALHAETLDEGTLHRIYNQQGLESHLHLHWDRFSHNQRMAIIRTGKHNRRLILGPQKFRLSKEEKQHILETDINTALSKLKNSTKPGKPEKRPSNKLIQQWIYGCPKTLVKNHSNLLDTRQLKEAIRQAPAQAICSVPEQLDASDIEEILHQEYEMLMLSTKVELTNEQLARAINLIRGPKRIRARINDLPEKRLRQAGEALGLIKGHAKKAILQRICSSL